MGGATRTWMKWTRTPLSSVYGGAGAGGAVGGKFEELVGDVADDKVGQQGQVTAVWATISE